MKTLIHSVLLLAITTIYSQNTIEGTVTDSHSKEPLTYVNIYLPELEKGTITNDKGTFSIHNLPSGNYNILFSIIGYKTLSTTISLPLTNNLIIALISIVSKCRPAD